MNDSLSHVLDELKSIIGKIRDNKTYGSVELYFEGGEITQITQRVINKLKKANKEEAKKVLPQRNYKKDLVHQAPINLE